MYFPMFSSIYSMYLPTSTHLYSISVYQSFLKRFLFPLFSFIHPLVLSFSDPIKFLRFNFLTIVHCKKVSHFPVRAAGMSLSNSPWQGKFQLLPVRGSFVIDIQAEEGKMANLFYSVSLPLHSILLLSPLFAYCKSSLFPLISFSLSQQIFPPFPFPLFPHCK